MITAMRSSSSLKEVDVERTAAKFFTSLSSKGYPIELRRLDLMHFKIEKRRITVDFIIKDIYIAKNRIYIETRPSFSDDKPK